MWDFGAAPVSTAGTVPGLGSFPDGDPEAIRAVADQLRRIAGLLAGAPKPAVASWSSPEATRVRGRLSAAVGVAGRGADEIRGCAAALDHAADELAADQRDWRLAKRRLDEARRLAETQGADR
ncbi:hypothetical protein [Luedemannella helvata]|uniref:Uncharacterized protein n=1 Tax=Luedemannella helvata TaxID=349315 RepID=A0ABN2KFP1_9ACTN